MITLSMKNWIEFVTGVEVKKAPYTGSAPSTDYITYQILTIVPMQHGFKNVFTPVVGEDVLHDWTKFTSASMTVSINAYAPSGLAYLNKLTNSSDWWEARQILKEDGDDIVFIESTRPQNLTGLGDEGYVSRYQSDFTFNITIRDERTIHAINEWLLTGVFANSTETINSTIVYPA